LGLQRKELVAVATLEWAEIRERGYIKVEYKLYVCLGLFQS